MWPSSEERRLDEKLYVCSLFIVQEHPDAESLSVRMNIAVDEAFRKAGPDALREHLEWERTTAIKPDVSCGAAAGKNRWTSRDRERAASGRSGATGRGSERAAPETTGGEDRLKSRYREEEDTGTCSRLPDHGHGTCAGP